jgi:hypothetical protein
MKQDPETGLVGRNITNLSVESGPAPREAAVVSSLKEQRLGFSLEGNAHLNRVACH